MFQLMDKISYYIGKVCSWISGIAVFFLMVIVILDVTLRKVFSAGLSGGFEYCQVFMLVLVFFALAYTQQQKGTVHVTFFVVKFKGRLRYIVWAVGMLIALVMTVVFTWGSYVHGMLMLKVGTKFATTLIPYWPFYMLGTFTFGLFTIVMLFDTIKAFAAIFSEKTAREIDEEWVS